jgi:hypothetical protein
VSGIADSTPGFCVAPFAFDGELLAVDQWPFSKLSSKWLAVCDAFLGSNGSDFNASWAGPLNHIRTRFSSASGTALVTFQVNGTPVSSLALVSGVSEAADIEVLTMFVNSLRGVSLVRSAAKSSTPFEQALRMQQRPLMVVVVWAPTAVSDQDHELVRELSLHIAGAFFQRSTSAGGA